MAQDEHDEVHANICKLMADTMRISEASRRVPYETMTMLLAGGAIALLLFACVRLVMKLLA